MNILTLLKNILILCVFWNGKIIFAVSEAQKGELLYKKRGCRECHGEKGEGRIDKRAPKLAGQLNWYIVSSLMAFQVEKERKNTNPLDGKKIKAHVVELNKKDMEDIATYLSEIGPSK